MPTAERAFCESRKSTQKHAFFSTSNPTRSQPADGRCQTTYLGPLGSALVVPARPWTIAATELMQSAACRQTVSQPTFFNTGRPTRRHFTPAVILGFRGCRCMQIWQDAGNFADPLTSPFLASCPLQAMGRVAAQSTKALEATPLPLIVWTSLRGS